MLIDVCKWQMTANDTSQWKRLRLFVLPFPYQSLGHFSIFQYFALLCLLFRFLVSLLLSPTTTTQSNVIMNKSILSEIVFVDYWSVSMCGEKRITYTDMRMSMKMRKLLHIIYTFVILQSVNAYAHTFTVLKLLGLKLSGARGWESVSFSTVINMSFWRK